MKKPMPGRIVTRAGEAGSQAIRAQRAALPQVMWALVIMTAAAALTALGARVMIPWWPVPATLQVFFVLLSGAALGPRLGAGAQAQYVLAGALGLPMFASGLKAGPGVLLGPTGGYLVGFVGAAYVTGWVTQRIRRRASAYLGALAGVGLIWMCGWLWLAAWMAVGGEAAPWRAAFMRGVAPFVTLDLLKALAAAAVARPLRRGLKLAIREETR